jgi:hypothetical protein
MNHVPPNEVTGTNAGGLIRLLIPAILAARIALMLGV